MSLIVHHHPHSHHRCRRFSIVTFTTIIFTALIMIYIFKRECYVSCVELINRARSKRDRPRWLQLSILITKILLIMTIKHDSSQLWVSRYVKNVLIHSCGTFGVTIDLQPCYWSNSIFWEFLKGIWNQNWGSKIWAKGRKGHNSC